jgi:predicted dehydrogenase
MGARPNVSRREFLKTGVIAGAGAGALGGLGSGNVLGANDRIRVGVLGCGSRGQMVMKRFNRYPAEAEVVAVCDVYAPRRDEGLKLAGPNATACLDYREILDRKDVDAVLIASPDHWHKPMLIDAVRAGKDAYVEKPIMHTIEEGKEMVRAVEETGRIVQTGTQQRNCEPWLSGKQIVESGKLGKITFIHTYWYQNYGAPGEGLSPVDTARLDWKRFLGSAPGQPFSLEKFHFWRWYWDFGGGMLTDLLTHWIDVVQWYMEQPAPRTAVATGSLLRMDWEAPDTITACFEYPGDFQVAFTGAINSSVDDGGIEFRGSQATMKIDRTRLMVYPENGTPVPGTLTPDPELIVRFDHDGTLENVKNFLDCARSRKTPNASIQAGFEAARASLIGNLALRRGTKISWNKDEISGSR